MDHLSAPAPVFRTWTVCDGALVPAFACTLTEVGVTESVCAPIEAGRRIAAKNRTTNRAHMMRPMGEFFIGFLWVMNRLAPTLPDTNTPPALRFQTGQAYQIPAVTQTVIDDSSAKRQTYSGRVARSVSTTGMRAVGIRDVGTMARWSIYDLRRSGLHEIVIPSVRFAQGSGDVPPASFPVHAAIPLA